jgi:hypothetical protein
MLLNGSTVAPFDELLTRFTLGESPIRARLQNAVGRAGSQGTLRRVAIQVSFALLLRPNPAAVDFGRVHGSDELGVRTMFFAPL